MGADDRELRNRFEALQVQTKRLRAQLEDPDRLDEVRTEVGVQLLTLQKQTAVALAKLTELRPRVEDMRVESMRRKRAQGENDLTGHLGATGRLAFGIVTTLAAGVVGSHWGNPLSMPGLGWAACAAGACGFVAVVWKIGADLKR